MSQFVIALKPRYNSALSGFAVPPKLNRLLNTATYDKPLVPSVVYSIHQLCLIFRNQMQTYSMKYSTQKTRSRTIDKEGKAGG